MPALRHPVVDGLFYPAAPATLRAQVTNHLVAAGADDNDADNHAPLPPPKLLITPHAGYEYCGAVAACAYAQLRRRRARSIRRVVLLGHAHRVVVQGLAAPRASAFATPLGEVALDAAALARLHAPPQVVRDDRAHEREHSIEVQLPFVQALLCEFSLVPLVVGDAGAEEVAQVLERLWGGDETLIAISSDLSHYLPYAQTWRLAGGTGSTTDASSATCVRATAGCARASAACVSFANASATRWCSRPTGAARAFASTRSRRSR